MIDLHPAAVRYDLLKHGYKLRDLGTAELWWSEAFAIITQQPPALSAVYRALHPDEYDYSKVQDRLEGIAVLLVQQHLRLYSLLTGEELNADDLPRTWADLVSKPETQQQLMTFEEIDARMGWNNQNHEAEATPLKLLTFEEIDERLRGE